MYSTPFWFMLAGLTTLATSALGTPMFPSPSLGNHTIRSPQRQGHVQASLWTSNPSHANRLPRLPELDLSNEELLLSFSTSPPQPTIRTPNPRKELYRHIDHDREEQYITHAVHITMALAKVIDNYSQSPSRAETLPLFSLEPAIKAMDSLSPDDADKALRNLGESWRAYGEKFVPLYQTMLKSGCQDRFILKAFVRLLHEIIDRMHVLLNRNYDHHRRVLVWLSQVNEILAKRSLT